MKNNLFLFFILLSCALPAQTDTTKSQPVKDYDKARFILSPGASYQKQFMGELNIMYAKTIFGHGYIGSWGPRLGIESNFNPTHFIYAPKIGYEYNLVLLSFRACLVSYVDNTKIDLRLLPEVGLSFFTIFNLNYGYGIPLLNYETTQISRHRLTLTINLDVTAWEAL